MADHPMLFSAPMIRALIAGQKTQTRRLTGIEDTSKIMDFVKVATDQRGRSVYEMKDRWGSFVSIPARKNFVTPHYSPRIGIGDRVYVREAWRVSQKWEDTPPRDLPVKTMTVFCEAGGSIANQQSGRWEPDFAYPDTRPEWVGKLRPAMHQPRWASRITLLVDDVRVERLQACSEADAVAEGIVPTDGGFIIPGQYSADGSGRPRTARSAISAYDSLWQMINGVDGPKSWDANPWVVAYTFRVVLQNIDQIARAT